MDLLMRLRRFLFALVEGASVYLLCCRFGVGDGCRSLVLIVDASVDMSVGRGFAVINWLLHLEVGLVGVFWMMMLVLLGGFVY